MAYKDRIDPELLCPIPRRPQRAEMGLTDPLPFWGWDIWTAYELSWLNRQGKPKIALADFFFPADSPNLIESKSLKLYLNSLNQTLFESGAGLQSRITEDLGRVSGCPVQVVLKLPEIFGGERIETLQGESLDHLEVNVSRYRVDPGFLAVKKEIIEETLTSDLFKTNCPITGQPDWAGIQIRYRGPAMDRTGLLKYLISFRQHQAFHETCVERIFLDLSRCCRPEKLTVYARYTRRGGLDINPFRTNYEMEIPRNIRIPRQ